MAEAIELEGRRKTGREDDLLGERLWQRSSAKVKQEDDGYDVSSVESGEDGGEAGGKGRWERRRERRRRQLEKIEKEREKRGKKKAPKRPRPARDEGDAEDEAEDEQRLAGSLAAHLEGVRRGDTDSMVSAGLCYFHGRGTPIDVGYAEELLTTAAERGSARAAFNLGAMFDKGAGDVLRRNNTRAVGWFRLAAGWGHAQSQYRLGASLERQGRREEALGWYRKAAGQGVAGAVLSAGLVLVSGGAGGEGAGWGGEGEALLRKAAEGGIGRAMYELASREAGGVNPWLKRAAEAGYVPAMSRWGSALLVGEGGIPKQEPVAAEWLEKAAEGGDASAQAQIGVMYLRGFKKAICDEGFVDVKDEEKGFGWLLAAAKRGWVEAQYMLGQRYASQVELPRVLKEEAGDSGGAEEVEKYDRYAPIDPSTVGQKRRGAAKKEFQVAREKAEAWLQRAVDGGHAGACWALSRLILSSKKAGEEKGGESRRGTKGRIEERDAARRNAFSLVSRAAEGGLPEAQCEMGGIWRDGRWGLVPPNVTASTGWYLQAAMAGFPAAQLELAHALIGGVGVARDEVKAVGWLEHASRGGVLEARVELGARHMGMAARPEARERLVGESGGGGIRWDETLGEKLVRSAAEGGHTGAMVMLGRWLAGRGRAEEGAEWVVRAARAGVGEAQLEAGLKMLEAGAKDAVARSEGMRLVKEAVRNGVEGAAAKHKEWVAALGLQPKAPGGEAGSFAGAHLVEKHELHAECGRLGVKVIRAEGMPRVCSGQEWRKGVTDVGRTGAPRCSVVVGSAAGGEGEEVEGEEAVRWVSLVKRPGRAFKIKASDRFTEVEEAREQDEVSTHISWDAQCAPHWNSSFAAYLNGSKAAWTEPMRVCVYAHVSHNIGPVVIAEGSFLPWETPLKRRIRLWVDVVPEAIPQIVHSKKGRVLVELWRTRDVIPASMRQTNEAKRLAMLPPWIPMQDTHTEARDRREQAAIDMVADYIIDPTMIEMGDGTVVPYEVLDLYEHPNMFEPITGSHKDPKFLFEFFGDFHREAVRDIWTEQGPDGRWMVPNGLKVEKAQRNDDFYKWLRKFTGGRLTIDDVPPGHLNPRINGLQVVHPNTLMGCFSLPASTLCGLGAFSNKCFEQRTALCWQPPTTDGGSEETRDLRPMRVATLC